VDVWRRLTRSGTLAKKGYINKANRQPVLSNTKWAIELNKLRFHSGHGVYEQEKLTGNIFEVDLVIHFKASGPVLDLCDTINYADAFAVVKNHMDQPVQLLETLAERVLDDIGAMDQRIQSVVIRITKCDPPISRFTGQVSVRAEKIFDR